MLGTPSGPIAPDLWKVARVVDRPPRRSLLPLSHDLHEWTLEPAGPAFWDQLVETGPEQLAQGGVEALLLENGAGGSAVAVPGVDCVAVVRGIPDEVLLTEFRLTRYPPPPEIVRISAEAAALMELRELDLSPAGLPKLALVPREPALGILGELNRFLNSPLQLESVPKSPEQAERREKMRRDFPRHMARGAAIFAVSVLLFAFVGLASDGDLPLDSFWIWWSAAGMVAGSACLYVTASNEEIVKRSRRNRGRFGLAACLLPMLPCLTQIALALILWDDSFANGPEWGLPIVMAWVGGMFSIPAQACMNSDAAERAEAEGFAPDGKIHLLEDPSERGESDVGRDGPSSDDYWSS